MSTPTAAREAQVRATPTQLHLRHRWLPGAVVGVAMVVQLGVAILHTRDMWFVRDDWDFLTKRGTIPDADRGIFASYGGHWVTGPVFIYRILFAIFGARHYLPYALMTILLHLCVVLVLYLLLRRLAVYEWVAVSMAVLMTFAGAGAEAFLWDSTVPQMGSLFLGMSALLVLAPENLRRRRLVAGGALLCLAMAFSGFGIAVAAFVFVWLILTQRPLVALQTVAPSMLLFAVWFLAVGHAASPPRLVAGDYLQVPLYVWTGLASALNKASGIPNAGGALVIALFLAPALARGVSFQLRCLAWAGIAAALAQQTLAALTRLGFGLETAASSRYSYAVLLFLIPSLAVLICAALPKVAEPRWMALALAFVILTAYVANALQMEREFAHFQQAAGDRWKSRVAGMLAAVDDHQEILTPVLRTPFDGDFNAKLVADRRTRDKLPDLRADAQARLNAENEFFVGVGKKSFDLFSPTRVSSIAGFDTQFRQGAGCSSYNATTADASLSVETRGGTEIGVTGPSTSISTQLTRGSVGTEKQVWPVDPGSVYIASSAKDAQLVVTFDRPGRYVICNE